MIVKKKNLQKFFFSTFFLCFGFYRLRTERNRTEPKYQWFGFLAIGSVRFATKNRNQTNRFGLDTEPFRGVVLSRYVHNLSSTHCALGKRMLRYIAGTINVGLTFNKQSENSDLIDYSDSDFAGLKDKRHSTRDYIFMLADDAISHSSKQQFIIALSSCEAEYMVLSEAAKKAIWIREFLRELEFRFRDDQLVLIFADNKGAIDLIINPLYHKRTKHIEVRWHWIREMVDRKKITLKYLLISEMVADGLIKPLSVFAFSKFRIMLNLSS
jgi:hypothetical protein